MYKLALIVVSSVFVAMSPAVAAGAQDKWIVTQLSGDARVLHAGLQPASLKVNSQIVSGDTVVTGPTGRATLVRGADYIIIAPRSELRLPTTPEATGFTRVVEKLGTMLFKIQHTGIPHFAVDTPMLAAVVKGTTFSITVDPNRSAIQVIQGVVQVTAVEGGMSRLVEGGRTVFVNHSDPKTLLDADKPAPSTATPSSTAVRVSATAENPLASVSQLTAGLVRVEADSPQLPARVALAAPEAPVAVTAATANGTPTATVASATAPPVTGASVTAPNLTLPSVTGASAAVASVTTPAVLIPSVSTPTVTVPSITVASIPTPTVPVVSTPTVIVPSVPAASPSTPTVIIPSVATPSVMAPSVTVASISTPTVTVPSVTTPAVAVPPVTVASVTTPAATVPSVSTPTATIPTVSTPTLSTPTVAVPSVTVPSVTTPLVTVPASATPTATVPPVTVQCVLRC